MGQVFFIKSTGRSLKMKKLLCVAIFAFVVSLVFAQEGQAGMSGDGRSSASGRTYNVGDSGPAGGHVFYDKGVFSGGWRYLEAAPVETEIDALWGGYGTDVPGTVTVVGSGRQNTQLIINRLRQLNEMNQLRGLGHLNDNGRAAQLCASLNFGGCNDWFLPSKDELDLMYKNLKQKGLGGFSNTGWYWSSSQDLSTNAWNQYFRNGSQYSRLKFDTCSVRAVRAF